MHNRRPEAWFNGKENQNYHSELLRHIPLVVYILPQKRLWIVCILSPQRAKFCYLKYLYFKCLWVVKKQREKNPISQATAKGVETLTW